MGLAIDTVAGSALNPGAAFTACVAAAGDSFTVRNVSQQSLPKLEKVVRGGASTGAVRVRSPLLHDPTQGIRFFTVQTPTVFLMPQETGQTLHPTDLLTVEVTGGGAETDAAALQIYYPDLPGASARLHMWSDVSPLIKNIKPIVVAIATGAVGTWVDTLITTTEDLTHANTDYAVLGYVVDVATMLVGIKGIDIGNLRYCGPGSTDPSDTSHYYVERALREGTPHIPVFNAANKGATFVSSFHNAGTQNVNVTLICAELSQNLVG